MAARCSCEVVGHDGGQEGFDSHQYRYGDCGRDESEDEIHVEPVEGWFRERSGQIAVAGCDGWGVDVDVENKHGNDYQGDERWRDALELRQEILNEWPCEHEDYCEQAD